MGPELMENFRKQAERFGTEMIPEDATRVDFSAPPFKVWAGDVLYEGHTVIIATGASSKLLGLEAEMQLMGRGVSTCATCDGFFFKDQKIMVVGGGDSALEEALYLSRLGSSVDLVHRRDTLRGSKIMQDRAFKNPKIQFLWDSAVEDILDPAQGKVTGVKLRNVKTGALAERPVDGLFVAIGHLPNTQLVRGQIDLLPNEYIKVKPGTTQTSVAGVFAAGGPPPTTKLARGQIDLLPNEYIKGTPGTTQTSVAGVLAAGEGQDHVSRRGVRGGGTGCRPARGAERNREATHPH